MRAASAGVVKRQLRIDGLEWKVSQLKDAEVHGASTGRVAVILAERGGRVAVTAVDSEKVFSGDVALRFP